uniref:Uncharacterized protein n=1 Tax=Arundo donax TaxID=35708 RepID=A0A0A8ZYI1_ARUDO
MGTSRPFVLPFLYAPWRPMRAGGFRRYLVFPIVHKTQFGSGISLSIISFSCSHEQSFFFVILVD